MGFFYIFLTFNLFKKSWPVPSFDISIAFSWQISSVTAQVICCFHYFIIFIFSIFRLWDDPRHHNSSSRPPPPSCPHPCSPGNEVGLIPSTSNLISNPIVLMYPCMCCTAVPRISRPSDEQFLKCAREGKTEQVAEALLHYPDLVHVQDSVSDLRYCNEDPFPSLCDCLLCVSPLDARFITTQSSPRLQLWYNFLERYPSQRCDCLLPTVIFYIFLTFTLFKKSWPVSPFDIFITFS